MGFLGGNAQGAVVGVAGPHAETADSLDGGVGDSDRIDTQRQGSQVQIASRRDIRHPDPHLSGLALGDAVKVVAYIGPGSVGQGFRCRQQGTREAEWSGSEEARAAGPSG